MSMTIDQMIAQAKAANANPAALTGVTIDHPPVTEVVAQPQPAATPAEKAANVAEARKDPAAEKNEANYKAAKERCDALSGDAKSKCVDDAKRMHGQN